jgi:ribonuclease HI
MYSLYFDGASKCNPGKAGCGAVIYDSLNNEMYFESMFLGDNITNNVAEYTGLVVGLRLAIKENINDLIVYGDSLLVINQMKKVWKVKSINLINIYEDAMKLVNCFDNIHFVHIKRHLNKRADELANHNL